MIINYDLEWTLVNALLDVQSYENDGDTDGLENTFRKAFEAISEAFDDTTGKRYRKDQRRKISSAFYRSYCDLSYSLSYNPQADMREFFQAHLDDAQDAGWIQRFVGCVDAEDVLDLMIEKVINDHWGISDEYVENLLTDEENGRADAIEYLRACQDCAVRRDWADRLGVDFDAEEEEEETEDDAPEYAEELMRVVEPETIELDDDGDDGGDKEEEEDKEDDGLGGYDKASGYYRLTRKALELVLKDKLESSLQLEEARPDIDKRSERIQGLLTWLYSKESEARLDFQVVADITTDYGLVYYTHFRFFGTDGSGPIARASRLAAMLGRRQFGREIAEAVDSLVDYAILVEAILKSIEKRAYEDARNNCVSINYPEI